MGNKTIETEISRKIYLSVDLGSAEGSNGVSRCVWLRVQNTETNAVISCGLTWNEFTELITGALEESKEND